MLNWRPKCRLFRILRQSIILGARFGTVAAAALLLYAAYRRYGATAEDSLSWNDAFWYFKTVIWFYAMFWIVFFLALLASRND